MGAPDLREVWKRDSEEAPPAPDFIPTAAVRRTDETFVVAGALRSPDLGGYVFSVFTLDIADGATRSCGDGTVNPGEACDDGNVVEGDCCRADCTGAEPDDAPCDDESVCTLGDRCREGLCTSASRLPCEPCGLCYDELGCLAHSHATCGRSSTTDGAALAIARPSSGDGRLA